MDKKIVLKAMEQLILSPEWSIVKNQLVEEKNTMLINLMAQSINWSESQIKASIESIKVYDNIIECPDRIFTSFGGQLQVED